MSDDLATATSNARATAWERKQVCIAALLCAYFQIICSFSMLQVDFANQEILEATFFGELSTIIYATQFSTILHMMVMANISKQWTVLSNARRMAKDGFSDQELYIVRFNLRFLTALLKVFDSELNRVRGTPEFAASLPEARISDTMAMVLPALRTYSSYMLCEVRRLGQITLLGGNAVQTSTALAVERFWTAYVGLINTMNEAFSVVDLRHKIGYLFEEDVACIGYVPFENETSLRSRFLCADGSILYQKYRCSDVVDRFSAKEEALYKIKTFLQDAEYIQGLQDAPIYQVRNADNISQIIYDPKFISNPSDLADNVADAGIKSPNPPTFYLGRYRTRWPVGIPVLADGSKARRGRIAIPRVLVGELDVKPSEEELVIELEKMIHPTTNEATMMGLSTSINL